MKEGRNENNSSTQSLPKRLVLPTEVFGRIDELRTIHDAVEVLNANQSVCLELSGEPGTGKSHIKKNAIGSVANVHVFSFSFKRGSKSRPYELLNELFDGLLSFLGEMKNDIELSSWYQKVSPLIEGLPSELVESMPFMDRTSLKGKKNSKKEVAPTTNRQLLEHFYIDFAKELFGEINRKLILEIDNLSLYERGTLDILFKIFTNVNCPVMIVLSGRPGEWQLLRKEMLSKEDDFNHKQFSIELQNFTPDEIGEFIEFSLEGSVDRLDELAQLAFETTSGNPKSLIESLRILVKESSLFCNKNNSVWKWQIDSGWFKSKMSIVSLFMNKYDGLDQSIQKVLDFSSCLGSSINAPILAKLLQLDLNHVKDMLQICSEEGFLDKDIVSTQQGNRSQGSYHFSSEDVAQSIQDHLSDEQQQKYHRVIANHFINHSAIGVSDHDVFEAASHLNRSLDLPMLDDEQEAFTKLNILAAKKSRLLTSFETANDYIRCGIQIGSKLSWERSPEVLKELYIEAYHLSRLKGDDNAASEYLNIAFNKFDNDGLYEIMFVKMVLEIQFGLLKEGLATGLEVLSSLGFKAKSNTGRLSVAIEFVKTRRLLYKKSIDEIYNLEEISNKRLERIFQVIFWLYRASQYVAPELNGVLALRQLQLMLKYGTNGEAWSSLMAYGVIIGAGMNDYETAFKYSELGGRIAEKYGNNSGKVIFGKAIYWPFKHPLAETLKLYELSKEKLYREGDYIGAAEATVNESLTMLSLGYDLDDVVNKIHENLDFCEKVSTVNFQEFQKMLILNLEHLRKGSDEEVSAKLVTLVDNTEYGITRSVNQIVNIKLAYLKGDFDQALRLIEDASKEVENLTGLYFKTEYDFYSALTYLSLIREGKGNGSMKRKLARIIKRFIKWSEYAPKNYSHKRDLLMGIELIIEGNCEKAYTLLKLSEELSKELNNLHVQAIVLSELGNCKHVSPEQREKDLKASKEAFINWGIKWK